MDHQPSRTTTARRGLGVGAVVLAGLAVTACGSDSDAGSATVAATAAPVATAAPAPAATTPATVAVTTPATDAVSTTVEQAQISGGEVALVSSVRPIIDALKAALESGDVEASRAAYADYDAGWNGIEVYVNVRDKDLYEKLEQDLQGPIGDALEGDSPDLASLVPIAEELGTTYDQAIANSTTGAPLSPLFDDVTAMRIVRRDLRRTTALLQAGDLPGATATFNRFRGNYPQVQDLVKLRSDTADAQITEAIAKAGHEFDEADEPIEEIAPLVSTLSGRYNFAVSLWNAAARNADLAKTTFTPEDVAGIGSLREFEAAVSKSLDSWKSNDFAGATSALETAKTAFAKAQPALAAKNADATITAAFDAYSPLIAAAGDAPTTEAGATALIEAGRVAEQVLVGQFWTDPALQAAVSA